MVCIELYHFMPPGEKHIVFRAEDLMTGSFHMNGFSVRDPLYECFLRTGEYAGIHVGGEEQDRTIDLFGTAWSKDLFGYVKRFIRPLIGWDAVLEISPGCLDLVIPGKPFRIGSA